MPSSRADQRQKPMTFEVMEMALGLLNDEIAKSELLVSVAPIRLITIGGSLAVRLCKNRPTSYDIDCILSPNVATAADYAKELYNAVTNVAEKGYFEKDWLNRDLEIFVRRDRRATLFLESLQQDIPIYKGSNLEIYAGALHWALERKIRRVAHALDRRGGKDVDVPDAAALIRQIGAPISADYIRNLNFNGFDPKPTDAAIKEVADYYAHKYGEVGITGI
ncbi:hypothetical protein HRG_014917 [Hirsutella rhossiliensis]